MKKLLFLLIGLTAASMSYSQNSKVEDELKVLYADEKYQKCADKALKYADGKYKNEPVVYIYASMSCLKMSQNFELSQEFPKAFKDALTYAAKYRKKDKSGAIYDQYLNHFEELKSIVAEEIDNYLLEERKEKIYKAVKKSVGLMKKINAMDPDDKGALLLRGLLEVEAQNAGVGKPMIKAVLPQIKAIKATRAEMPVIEKPVVEEEEEGKKKKKKSKEPVVKPPKAFEEMSEMEQVNLRMGLMGYANYLHRKGKTEEAKEIIELGKKFFYKENDLFIAKYDTKYKAIYNKIIG